MCGRLISFKSRCTKNVTASSALISPIYCTYEQFISFKVTAPEMMLHASLELRSRVCESNKLRLDEQYS